VEGDFETWRPTGRWSVIIFNESIGYARDPGATVDAFSAYLEPAGAMIVSLFQSGNQREIWQRILRNRDIVRREQVRDNATAKTWDICALGVAKGAP
jgi:hypothetical protein